MRKKDLDAELKSGIATEMMHVHRQLMQYGSRAMEKLNIGVGQMPILLLLDERKTMTQRQIAEEIRVTPATICGTLKRMEKNGFIIRTPDENDARISRVQLTEAGKAQCEHARRIFDETCRQMLSCLDDDSIARLSSLLTRIQDHLGGVKCCQSESTKKE